MRTLVASARAHLAIKFLYIKNVSFNVYMNILNIIQVLYYETLLYYERTKRVENGLFKVL